MILVKGNRLTCGGRDFRCAVGRNGFSSHKREGDLCTPVGEFFLRECWYRADRLEKPQTGLPLKIIRESDGWCDDPKAKEYNKHVSLPRDFSHEKLFRDDHVYDVVVPLGYNDNPVIPGKGSAIFLHVAKPGYASTEGCVALSLPDLLTVLENVSADTKISLAP